jgi:hypothetical protein
MLVQVPLVGVFIWFSLKMNEHNLAAMSKRDAEWREFLREQREANNQALGRLAEELKQNTQGLAVVQNSVLTHDNSIREVMPMIREAVDKVRKG